MNTGPEINNTFGNEESQPLLRALDGITRDLPHEGLATLTTPSLPLHDHPMIHLLADAPELVERLTRAAEIRQIAQGQILFSEGAPSTSVILVLDGKIDVRKLNAKGEYESALIYEAGGDFGEYGVRDGQGRVGQAVALEDATIAEIPGDVYLDVLYGPARKLGSRNDIRNSLIARAVGDLYFAQRLEAEQTRHEAELQEARSTSDRKFTHLGQVMTQVLHDLRNLLHVDHMRSEMILDVLDRLNQGKMGAMDALKRIESHSMSNLSTNRAMVAMTTRVLEFSKGAHILNLEQMNIATLLNQLVKTNQETLEHEGITLTVKPIQRQIMGDPLALPAVFQNLIKNAEQELLKRRCGNIWIEAAELEPRGDSELGGVRIDVRDDGSGIPEDLLKTIFKPHVSSGKVGGSGIGLFNAQQIIRAHNGSITVASSSAGTIFTIVILDKKPPE